MTPLLLDTCALLWFVRREPMRGTSEPELLRVGAAGLLYVSAVSAWEVGLLHRKRGYLFEPDPRAWFARVLALPFMRQAPLTADQALESALLPEPLHDDPADRMLVATARDLGATLVTRDKRLLDYGAAGHLQVLPC